VILLLDVISLLEINLAITNASGVNEKERAQKVSTNNRKASRGSEEGRKKGNNGAGDTSKVSCVISKHSFYSNSL
jgi:hypothetical protein